MTSWTEQHAVAKLEGGKTVTTDCEVWNLNALRPDNLAFKFRPSHTAFELAAQGLVPYEVKDRGLITEIAWRGKLYRVWSYQLGTEVVQLNGEPIGRHVESSAPAGRAPGLRDQIAVMLKDAPEGMTARQIGDSLECGRSPLFRALSSLQMDGKVEKRGSLYLSPPNTAVGVPPQGD
jgi:hypothetical protein